MIEFLGGLVGWVVIAGAVFYIVSSIADAVKKVVAHKRAKGDDNKNDEKECDNGN